MPLRGENVGQAYVRIYADGSDLPDGIRDAMKGADGEISAAGKRHGEAYTEEFNKRSSQKDLGKGIRNALEKSIAKADVTNAFFNSREWERFVKTTRRRFGEAGEIAATEMRNEFTRRGDVSGLEKAMERIHERVYRATSRIQREEQAQRLRDLLNMLTEARQMNKAFDRQRLQDLKNMLTEAHDMNDAFDRRRLKALKDMLAEAYQLDKAYNQRQQTLLAEAYRMNREFDNRRKKSIEDLRLSYQDLLGDLKRIQKGERGLNITHKDLVRRLGEINDGMGNLNVLTDVQRKEFADLRKQIDNTTPSLTRMTHTIDRVADRSGRLFGRGSRNNFLNFLGSAVRGGVALLNILPRMASGITGLARTAGAAFTAAGGGFAGLMAGLVALGPALGAATASMAAFALALPVVLALLGVFATLLTAVVGVLIALAGSVIAAAIAGVIALGGALGIAAAGAGILAAGILAMSDAQKEMVKNATRPLVEALKDLGREASKGLFGNIEQQAKRLRPIIAGFEPLFYKVGRAFSRVGDSIIESMRSPEFDRFRKQMEVFIPNAVRTLGETMNNVFGGLGGFFLAARPFIRQFLNNLEDVTQNFSDWANSKKGRDEIRDFLEKAADSAEDVGDFILAIVDNFATLMDLGGQETGDSLFESMTNNIKEFTQYLKENPDAVKDFFEDAEDIAQDFGDIAVAVGDLIGELDELMGHPIVSGGLDALMWTLERIEDLFTGIELAVAGFNAALSGPGAGSVGKFVGSMGPLLSLPKKIQVAFKVLPAFVRSIFTLLGNAATKGATAVTKPFARVAATIMKHIDDLPGRVRSLLGRLPGIASTAANQVVRGFAGIAGRIMGHVTELPGRVRDLFHRVIGYVQGVPDRIVGFFSGLAGRILRAIGTIDIGSLIRMPNLSSIPDMVGKPGYRPGIPGAAAGMITNAPKLRWVGEDGPEAIVPLARDLSRVDPSVRWLSAIAQGKGMAEGGMSGKSVDASNWTIVSNAKDPEVVAQEVVNRLFAQSF